MEDKCKNIMTNYYKKNNAFADDDKEDDTHDELWSTNIFSINSLFLYLFIYFYIILL